MTAGPVDQGDAHDQRSGDQGSRDQVAGGVAQVDSRSTDAGDPTEELQRTVASLEDQARRAMADLDNSNKRHARDLERVRADERAEVSRQFLQVVDHLQLALDHAGSDPGSIIAGVEQVLGDANDTLARLGFARIDDVGVPFDPAKHEAVSVVELDGVEPGTVVHVVRPGFGEGSAQLRPASVVVSTGQP